MRNIFTIDLEDYFQVSAFSNVVNAGQWASMPSRLEPATARLLDLLAAANVRATVFVLAWNAEHYPHVVRRIADAGHEIASHGYAHRLVYELTPAQFRADLRRARHLLEDLTGRRIEGYRAPSFSITPASIWALDVLAEEGYAYDSSIFPIRHDRYGMPGAQRRPHYLTRQAGTLLELPPTTMRIGSLTLPAAGGGYLRQFPMWWTTMAIRCANASGAPAVVYVHPWELDTGQPRVRVPWLTGVRHYRNIEHTETRLTHLFRTFEFGAVADLRAVHPVPEPVAV